MGYHGLPWVNMLNTMGYLYYLLPMKQNGNGTIITPLKIEDFTMDMQSFRTCSNLAWWTGVSLCNPQDPADIRRLPGFLGIPRIPLAIFILNIEVQPNYGKPPSRANWLVNIWLMMVNHNLVGGFNQPLWKMMEWKSVGMMKFTMENHHPVMFQTTNQLRFLVVIELNGPSIPWWPPGYWDPIQRGSAHGICPIFHEKCPGMSRKP